MEKINDNTQETNKEIHNSPSLAKLHVEKESAAPEGLIQYRSIIIKDKLVIFNTISASSFLKTIPKVWIFDLKSSRWSSPQAQGKSFLVDNGEGYSICLDSENQIVVFGGWEGIAPVNNPVRNPGGVERIFGARNQLLTGTQREISKHMERLRIENSETMEWRQHVANNSAPFRKFHSANIYNDKMYVFGGKDQEGRVFGQLYICDMDTNNWMQFYPNEKSPGSRYEHTSVLSLGSIYIFGGMDDQGNYLNDLWSLNLNFLSWQKITPSKSLFPVARASASGHAIGNKIYIFGGQGHVEFQDLFVYRINETCWESVITKENLPVKGKHHTFVPYGGCFILGENNNLYCFDLEGGMNQSETLKDKDSTLKSSLRKFYEEKPFSDIVFKVEGQEIAGHKGFLASRCPLFANMFASGMKEAQSQEVEIPEMKAAVFEKLLEFLYCDDVKLTYELAIQLLHVAEEYSLPLLKKKCVQYLMVELNVNNVIDIANTAEMYEAGELIEASIDYIIRFKAAICEHHDISKLSKAMLVELFLRK